MMDNLTPSSNLGSPIPRKIPSPWGRRMKWAPDFTMNSSTKPASVNLSSRSAPVHSECSSSRWTKAKGPPKCQGNLHRLRLKALPRTRLAPADPVSRLDRVEPVIIYTGGPWCQVGTHRPRIQGLSHEHMSQDCHCGLSLQACILDPSIISVHVDPRFRPIPMNSDTRPAHLLTQAPDESAHRPNKMTLPESLLKMIGERF